MTFKLNQIRRGLRFNDSATPYNVTAPAFQSLAEVTVAGVAQGGAKMGSVLVHLIACDCQTCDSATHRHLEDDQWVTHPCVHESHNEAIPDHETYVPDGWGAYPDGTHKCPDCRTKRSLNREMAYRRELIKQNVTVEELRAKMAAFHATDE